MEKVNWRGGGKRRDKGEEPGKTGSRQGGHGAIPQQKGHGGETGLLICFSGQRRGWRQRHKDDDDDGGGEGKSRPQLHAASPFSSASCVSRETPQR